MRAKSTIVRPDASISIPFTLKTPSPFPCSAAPLLPLPPMSRPLPTHSLLILALAPSLRLLTLPWPCPAQGHCPSLTLLLSNAHQQLCSSCFCLTFCSRSHSCSQFQLASPRLASYCLLPLTCIALRCTALHTQAEKHIHSIHPFAHCSRSISLTLALSCVLADTLLSDRSEGTSR